MTPAFRCPGVWPRTAAHWPPPQQPWPHPALAGEVKAEGFDLLSKVFSSSLSTLLVTDRINAAAGNAIASVRPTDRLFVSTVCSEPTDR